VQEAHRRHEGDRRAAAARGFGPTLHISR